VQVQIVEDVKVIKNEAIGINMPPGAFFFLYTYVGTPVLIGLFVAKAQYLAASIFAIWWIPMICSAISDWRSNYFGFESKRSNVLFWVGFPLTACVLWTLGKLHIIHRISN